MDGWMDGLSLVVLSFVDRRDDYYSCEWMFASGFVLFVIPERQKDDEPRL